MEALDPARLGKSRDADDNRLATIFRDLQPLLSSDEAIVEADRCLECGGPYAPAPCIEGCPTHINVPGFITAIARGDAAQAAEVIFGDNVLGASCARVCPVEQFCEGSCVLQKEGRRPVSIGRLQRYAAEPELAKRVRFRSPDKANGKRVSVIGGGPAGLSCAAELALKGYQVVVYDKNNDFGGLVRYAIAPYRIRRDPIPNEAKMIARLGVDFRLGTEIDSKEKLKQIELESDAVFLGIGLGKDVTLHYPGEDLPGVWSSLEFIRSIKTGRPPSVGERVAVIGGGNTAIDVSREAKQLGAGEVTLYYRRTKSQMPAYPHEVEEAIEEGIRFHFLTRVVAFHGNYQLESIELQYMQLSDPDASGRPRPVEVPGTEFHVPVDTAVLAIGQERRTGFLQWIDGVSDESGLVTVDPATCQTPNPKYFAGGDSLNGGATAVEAVQNGKIAAQGIERYLKEEIR